MDGSRGQFGQYVTTMMSSTEEESALLPIQDLNCAKDMIRKQECVFLPLAMVSTS